MLSCFPIWVYRETMCYVWFVQGACNPYVKWRAGLYRIQVGGTGVRVNEQLLGTNRKWWQLWKRRHPKSVRRREMMDPESAAGSYALREIKIEGAIRQQRFGANVESSHVCSLTCSACLSICNPCFYALYPPVRNSIDIDL